MLWLECYFSQSLSRAVSFTVEIFQNVVTFKKSCFICFNESPAKMMKDAFYSILKALFVLRIFRFLSWHFGQVENTERQG